MKLFTASALILLLAIQATATKPKWEELNPYSTPNAQILGFIGAGFIIQEALFENPEAPLPFSQYALDTIDKLERKVTDSFTYYRFHSTIYQSGGDNGAKATYTVSLRHSDNNFVVICPHYTTTKVWYSEYPGGTMIDLRGLNDGTSEFSAILEESLKVTVAKAIENGQLPESKYSLIYVYYAYYVIEDGKVFTFYTKIRNSEGRNFLYYMYIHTDYDQNIYQSGASVSL